MLDCCAATRNGEAGGDEGEDRRTRTSASGASRSMEPCGPDSVRGEESRVVSRKLWVLRHVVQRAEWGEDERWPWGRAGQGRAGQGRAGQGRAGQGRDAEWSGGVVHGRLSPSPSLSPTVRPSHSSHPPDRSHPTPHDPHTPLLSTAIRAAAAQRSVHPSAAECLHHWLSSPPHALQLQRHQLPAVQCGIRRSRRLRRSNVALPRPVF